MIYIGIEAKLGVDAKVDTSKPKKHKGKVVTYEKFVADKNKFLTESIAMRRNPYWSTRY